MGGRTAPSVDKEEDRVEVTVTDGFVGGQRLFWLAEKRARILLLNAIKKRNGVRAAERAQGGWIARDSLRTFLR